jgi:hypothetical protein
MREVGRLQSLQRHKQRSGPRCDVLLSHPALGTGDELLAPVAAGVMDTLPRGLAVAVETLTTGAAEQSLEGVRKLLAMPPTVAATSSPSVCRQSTALLLLNLWRNIVAKETSSGGTFQRRFGTFRNAPNVPKPFLAVQAGPGRRQQSQPSTYQNLSEADTATSTRIDSDPSCGHERWYSLAVLVQFMGCSRLRRLPRLGFSYCYVRSASSSWLGASRLGRL